MMTMIGPLHIATVGAHLLRFFTPLDDGLPDLPWHCVDDLHQCLRLNRAQRKLLLRELESSKWPAKTIAAADGIITSAPHFAAQGTVDLLVAAGMAPKSVRDAYDQASTEALKKLPHPPAAANPEAWLCWLKAATERWEQLFPQGDLFESACARVWRTLAPSLRAWASACADCGVDTVEAGEWYMVHDAIWLQAWDHISRSAPGLQILCIGCLEGRIGRTLCAEDFTDAPINDPHKYKSSRMRDRLTARHNGG